MTERDNLRWGLAQRFEFIEWRIYWTGRVNRSDLVEKFGVSTPQASGDLQTYLKIAPGNIDYDSTEKAYVACPKFRPLYLEVSSNRYLRQLDAILNHAISPGDTWFSSPPPAAVAQALARNVEPSILRGILKAIETQQEVRINYQSLTNTRERSIAPHSIAFDGHRWHTRAFCVDRGEFRDFNLTRILTLEMGEQTKANPSDDLEWITMTELHIVAHPKLDAAQRSAIERDYGMTDGVLRFKTRVALAFYVVANFNLDLSDEAVKPERKQIFLSNMAELEAQREAAKAAARERVAERMANARRT